MDCPGSIKVDATAQGPICGGDDPWLTYTKCIQALNDKAAVQIEALATANPGCDFNFELDQLYAPTFDGCSYAGKQLDRSESGEPNILDGPNSPPRACLSAKQNLEDEIRSTLNTWKNSCPVEGQIACNSPPARVGEGDGCEEKGDENWTIKLLGSVTRVCCPAGTNGMVDYDCDGWIMGKPKPSPTPTDPAPCRIR